MKDYVHQWLGLKTIITILRWKNGSCLMQSVLFLHHLSVISKTSYDWSTNIFPNLSFVYFFINLHLLKLTFPNLWTDYPYLNCILPSQINIKSISLLVFGPSFLLQHCWFTLGPWNNFLSFYWDACHSRRSSLITLFISVKLLLLFYIKKMNLFSLNSFLFLPSPPVNLHIYCIIKNLKNEMQIPVNRLNL